MQRLPLPKFNKSSSFTTFRSYSGFSIDQVISSLQKSVRRCYIEYDVGLEMSNSISISNLTTFDEALQWGLEMYLTSEVELNRGIKANRTNVWNRIFVIAVEDIGPSNPHLLINLHKLRSQDSAINIVKAIILLLNSKKCRVADWALHIPIPSVEEISSTEDLVYSCKEYKREQNFSSSLYCLLSVLRSKEISNILYVHLNLFPRNTYSDSIYNILVKYKKVDLCMLTVTTLFHLWYFDILPDNVEILPLITDEKAQVIVDKYQNHENLVGVPDYAIDKHTGLGKKKGRGLQHFLNIGAILYNRDSNWIDLDDYYLECIREKTK